MEKIATDFYRERNPGATEEQIAEVVSRTAPDRQKMILEKTAQLPEVPDYLFPYLALPTSSKAVSVIASMSWVIFKAPEDHPFVTTDDPVIHSAGLGLCHPDAFLQFPLSRKHLLQASWPKHFPSDYHEVSPEQVRHLNIELLKKAGREVYSGRDSTDIQTLVDEFMTSHHPRQVEHQVESPDGRIFKAMVGLSLEESVQLAETLHPTAKQKFLESLPSFQRVEKELHSQREAWRFQLLNSNSENLEVF